jgi:hypothetical protein
MTPPTVDDATEFIAAAVRRHHVSAPSRHDEVRHWSVEAVASACSIEKRTSYEERLLGRWEPRTSVARWRLSDVDPAGVHVTTERRGDKSAYIVTVPCEADRRCVDQGGGGRASAAMFAMTSALMAQRIAAAFRHAASLCEAR